MSKRKKSQLQEKVRISRNLDFMAERAESIFLRVIIPDWRVVGRREESWKPSVWFDSDLKEFWFW